MPEAGKILREARERKNLKLADVERELKIRQRFLSALEDNQRNTVLEEIYMRGFIKNYARFLGLDPDHILRLYTGEPEHPPQPEPPLQKERAKPKSKQVITPDANPLKLRMDQKARSYTRPVAVALAVFLVIGAMVTAAVNLARGAPPPAEATAAWALTRVIDPTGTALALAAASEPTATPKPSATPSKTPTITPTPTATLTPTPEFYTGVDFEMIVNSRAWVRVAVDGALAYEGILEPGARRSWHGDERVQLRCGNAGGVEVFINGESIGTLGEEGQVVDTEWLKEPAHSPAPTEELATAKTEGVVIEATAIHITNTVPLLTLTEPVTTTL